jgi:hypothetical protein
VLLAALALAEVLSAAAQVPPGAPAAGPGGPPVYPVPGPGGPGYPAPELRGPPGPPGYSGSGPGVFAAEPPPQRPPDFCSETEKPPYQDTAFVDPSAPRNAFVTDNHEGAGPPHYVFAGAGAFALFRERLTRGPIAVLEPVVLRDANIMAPAGSPELLDFHDVQTGYDWGVITNLGYRWGPDAVELSGFFLPRRAASATVNMPGSVDVLFGASPQPPPFQLATNPFLQTDIVEARLSTEVGSVEANCRHQLNDCLECFIGVRYFNVDEDFDILTEDLAGGTVFHILKTGMSAPGVQADYRISTQSHIVGPQMGLTYERLLVPGIGISLMTKNMVGADFFRLQHTLTRLDTGELGPGASRSGTQVSGVFEIGAFANWWLNDHIRLRAGYQALWVVNVPVASQNVSFNLNDTLGTQENHGNIFFHGPTLDLELTF